MAQITPAPRSGNVLSYILSWFTPMKPHAIKIVGFAATCIASYVVWRESNNLKLGSGIFFVGSALSLALPSNNAENPPLPPEGLAAAEKTNEISLELNSVLLPAPQENQNHSPMSKKSAYQPTTSKTPINNASASSGQPSTGKTSSILSDLSMSSQVENLKPINPTTTSLHTNDQTPTETDSIAQEEFSLNAEKTEIFQEPPLTVPPPAQQENQHSPQMKSENQAIPSNAQIDNTSASSGQLSTGKTSSILSDLSQKGDPSQPHIPLTPKKITVHQSLNPASPQKTKKGTPLHRQLSPYKTPPKSENRKKQKTDQDSNVLEVPKLQFFNCESSSNSGSGYDSDGWGDDSSYSSPNHSPR